MPTQVKISHAITVPEDLSGEAIGSFEGNLERFLAERPEGIDLDCSQLHLATSSHVNVLWNARQKCQEAGIPMRLCAMSPGLIRILRVLDIFELFSTDRAAYQEEETTNKRLRLEKGSSRMKAAIRPTSEDIYAVLNKLREFLCGLSIDDICCLELETVTYETLTNIRLHGHLGDKDLVELDAVGFADRIVITFTDSGQAFNPAGQKPSFDPGKAISDHQTGGIGLVMIARMTDAMEYERKDDRQNVLKLTKYWNLIND